MSMHGLVSRIVRLFSWLQNERQWTKWVVLTMAVGALVLLIWTVVANLRARAAKANQARQRKYWRQV